MRVLQGETLLTAWERGIQQTDVERAITLLQAAEPEWETDALAGLPLAERNRQLLELRALSFGRTLEGFAVCEHCGAQLEFALDALRLAAEMRPAEPQAWMQEDRAFFMRPVNTADLLACRTAADENEARRILLTRTSGLDHDLKADCPLESSLGLSAVPLSGLLPLFDTLNASAEIRLALRCAECGGVSELDLDIAQFLDRETDIAARRLLADIHRLAAAYGWSEQAITDMSSSRRAAYLAMLNA